MTIDELKKSNTSATIQVGNPEPVFNEYHNTNKEQPTNSAASISMMTGAEAEKEIREAFEENKQKKTVAMGTGAPKKNKSERVAASFSELPPDPREKLGVDIRESIEADVFSKGGPFDDYVEEKTREMNQWYEQKKAEAIRKAEEAQERSESIAEEKEEAVDHIDMEIDDDEDFDTTIPPAIDGKVIDITRKENKNMGTTNFDDELRPVDIEEPEDFEEEDVEESEDNDLDEMVNEINHNASIQNGEEVVEVYKEEVPAAAPTPVKSNIGSKINRVTRTYMEVDDNIDSNEDEEVETEVSSNDDDEEVEVLKDLISSKIIPVAKKLDISSFTVAKKGTESNKILETKEAAIAKWVLPATGIVVLLREISGSNLENIRTMLTRRPADMKGVLKIIYDHIVSPKPDSFEVWLRSIAFADYDHLYMAIYISAFAESNFLPIDCGNENCGKPYLTDDIQIMDMVKFKNDEAESKFTALYNSEPVNPNGLYTTAISAISEKFAIAFREPDLYSVLIEPQYFSDKDSRKYQQTLAVLPYIDAIYFIDSATRQLIPVEYKKVVNNAAKTALNKVKRYDAVLNTFNVDQNAILSAYTQKINERVDWFTYRIPETTCPNCGHVNPALEDQTASSLVFLRNRLGVLATI